MVKSATLASAKNLCDYPMTEKNSRSGYYGVYAKPIAKTLSPKKFGSMQWRRACVIQAIVYLPSRLVGEVAFAATTVLESLARAIYQLARLICVRPGACKALKDYLWKAFDNSTLMIVLVAKALLDFVRLIGGALILPAIAVEVDPRARQSQLR